MDKFADEAIKSSSNSKHVYKMHDSSAFTLDVVCLNTSNNNNNNEKMDDANQTTTSTQKFSNSMRQDSINSDFSPLTDSIQNDRQRNSIELRADDEYSINDDQSNASDEASDNNSTDNISFVSEDIVENVILLPNNFLSDDESTNSDDVVYAYRGADFEPVQLNLDVNADEETDYLEMDFEPDPASEIEPEPNQSIEPGCSHMAATSPNLFNTISNTLNNEAGSADLNIERTGVHKNWLAPIDVRLNGTYEETDAPNASNRTNCIENPAPAAVVAAAAAAVNIHTTNNNKLELNADSMVKESNKSLVTKENATATVTNGEMYVFDNTPYYDNTVSLSTKKYTGTIPKTNKIHIRPSRSKVSLPDYTANGNGLARFESQASSSAHCSLDSWSDASSQTHKRWRHSASTQPASSSYCDSLVDAGNNYAKRTVAAVRSMSFPNESLQDQKLLVNAVVCAPTCKREMENDVDQSISVTFESTYCTIDIIIKALEKIHVLPNLRVLQEALSDDEAKVSQMNIPEYLVYASKRYCNYKAVIAAIEQSCDDVDVKYFAPSEEVLETVHIPVRMIAARLQTNGSLSNILTIKNKKFHQANVLGKIVNMIRRFPNMRDAAIQNEFIAIPQYYRSGVICISKKKPATEQI